MKKTQKPQVLIGKKYAGDKNSKTTMQMAKGMADSPIYKYYEKEVQGMVPVAVRIKKGEENVKKVSERTNIDYAILIQSLKRVQNKKDHKSVKIISTQKVPYEIPAMYSLKSEMDVIVSMKRRRDILSKNICRTDVESLALDWKRVGGDLNGTICKYRRNYAGGNG